MKTLFLIVVIATTISIVAFGTYVIVHPIFGGIAPSSTIRGYIQIDTPGLEKTYKIGQPINFSVLIQGFGLYPCQSPQIAIYDNNTQTKSVFYYTTQSVSCPDSSEHYLFYFPSQNDTFSTMINKTGNYTVKVSIGQDSYQKQFSVTAYDITGIYDTGVTPMYINVANTNFTINYDVTGNGKILDAKMDMPSKSLVLSLKAPSNGTLTVILPRAMIDAKLPTGNDDKFYVLVNGQ
ncbi:MAG: hypothetical protein KGH87_08780, partial [Thaumarchaeota archaeon]|nr:hypothetical protein [Nitrososphaerota archaeon]